MEWLRKNIGMFAILSLTLGLAPFNPPHIWGKLQWIAGGGAFSGAQPMAVMDWFDVLLHGTPWVLLIAAIVAYVQYYIKGQKA
ncbi:MAG: hypothetical protein ACPG21_06190 [Crocinitomicaceae bacterium]